MSGTRTLGWLTVLSGVVAIGIGVAVLAWPEATLKVVGFLFGLNLLLAGLIRAALSLFVRGYPGWYRALGVAFGLLTAVIGLLCLRNLIGSLVFLTFLVGVAWLIEGVVELVHAGQAGPGRGARVAAGVVSVAAALVVMIWPELSLATFLAIGAILLMLLGIAQLVSGIAGLRRSSGGRPAVATA